MNLVGGQGRDRERRREEDELMDPIEERIDTPERQLEPLSNNSVTSKIQTFNLKWFQWVRRELNSSFFTGLLRAAKGGWRRLVKKKLRGDDRMTYSLKLHCLKILEQIPTQRKTNFTH
eukprot:TRINITY_DN33283_c0_g2_i1.p1 TRINITY_DN33283_c0_g2~~TRINITY_DN33283_c0_g2_i1.p1  ORF type:complete len:118 (+),score=12.38 TRINITY_DN33283_c0_g2_i1:460-813(+)